MNATVTQRSPERAAMLADIATTAIEGGVNYWAQVSGYTPSGDVRATLHDMEDDGAEHVVTLDTVARGLRVIIDGCRYAGPGLQKLAREASRTNEMPVNLDASAADAIVQAGIFGELVYG